VALSSADIRVGTGLCLASSFEQDRVGKVYGLCSSAFSRT
jgi:hypothetical protein